MIQIRLLKIVNRREMKHKALPVYVVGLSLVSAYIWGGFEPLISWMINPAKEFIYDFDINARNTFSLTFILCFFSFLYLYNPLQRSSNKESDTGRTNGASQEQKKVALDYNNQVVLIPVQKIRKITVKGNYTLVKDVEEREFEAKRSLRSWEDELVPSGFIRIHRSTLINRSLIESIEHRHNYTLLIKLQGEDTEVSVSRRYAAQLKKSITQKSASELI